MKAIIPVAGIGTRLRPHTHTAPKVLLPVAGKTILAHILDELISFGIKEVVFIVGYRGEMVRDYVHEHYASSLRTSYVEQAEMLGLGHAIWMAREQVDHQEPVLIVLGDTIFKADLKDVLSSRHSSIGVREVNDPSRFGVVELQEGRIIRMVEKPKKNPPSNLAAVGIYFIRDTAELFRCLDQLIKSNKKTADEFQLTDAFQMMIDGGVDMRHFSIDGWYDCGKPETLLSTNRILLQEQFADRGEEYRERYSGSIINPPVSIAPSAKIENSIIGPNVTIDEESYIKDTLISNSIVSKNSSVNGLILENSIISENAKIAGHSLSLNVGDSSEISFK